MNERDRQAQEFEEHRTHLRAVAYRMLGSAGEADDAVQEAWLRLNRAGPEVENMRAWLTTVVARVCLDLLRSRRARREEWLPELTVTIDMDPEVDPAREAELADSVGLALLVVLETLTPAERLAFVLHDMFAVPFEEIAEVVGRSPAAARQLASRARRRVRGGAPSPDADVSRQRELVSAFLAAARNGEFDALVAILDPEVVFRVDTGQPERGPVTGAEEVARAVLTRGAPFAPLGRPAIVNGAAGVVVAPQGQVRAVVSFTVTAGRIATIDVLANPRKLRGLTV